MKHRRLLICLLVSAGAVLLFAQARKGEYAPATLSELRQGEGGATVTDGSVYKVSAYALYPPALAEGDGRSETLTFCGSCHSARYIIMQPPLPAATWESEVTKMKKAFGASIPDDSAAKIVGYLQSHYTPETRKQ